jgi:hypothetical protein
MPRVPATLALLAALLASGCAGTAADPQGEGEGSGTQDEPSAATTPAWLIVEDRITAGGPWTRAASSLDALGVASVDAFWFQAPPANSTVFTRTTAAAQGPYDIDLWFHDADGNPLAAPGCATDGAEASCKVPAGAWQGRATAALGARLRVGVWVEGGLAGNR